MLVLRTGAQAHPIHTAHRIGAGVLGVLLLMFGSLVLARGPEFASTSGPVVMGLSANGLLATISVVVGALLIGAAAVGGRAASTIALLVGGLFLISGVGNVLVLDTALNMLAFRMSNVVFSLVVGAALLFLGAYGRLSGALPPGPYAAAPDFGALPYGGQLADAPVDRALAAAERAVAGRVATAEQIERVHAAAGFRSHEDRRQAWVQAGQDS